MPAEPTGKELVALVARSKAQEENWQGVLNRADAALYEAEKYVRNRWVAAKE